MKQKGFTIVELLIVIVIIGILVALAATTFKGIKDKNFNWCDTYKYSSIKDVPAECFRYFSEQKDADTNGDVR